MDNTTNKTCGFCGTSIHIPNSGSPYCTFCEMDLFPEDIQENGCRKNLNLNQDVLISDARHNTSALMEKNTFYLIRLLRLVRKERATAYNSTRIVFKATQQGGAMNEFQTSLDAGRKQYEYWSRKVWVIENILRERSSTYPARITDDFLLKMETKINEEQKSRMSFSYK